MAKWHSEIKKQQDSLGMDSGQLSQQEQTISSRNTISILHGKVPTLRDNIGNILLYEDKYNEQKNIVSANQFVSVELFRRIYDYKEMTKVLDLELRELYKSQKTMLELINELFALYAKIKDAIPNYGDKSVEALINAKDPTAFFPVSERQRLLDEIERLKKLLAEIKATWGDGGGGGTGEKDPRFPTVITNLPDYGQFSESTSVMSLLLTSLIYDTINLKVVTETTVKPMVEIKYYIVDRNTDAIYSEGDILTDRFIRTDKRGKPFPADNSKYDVILELVNSATNWIGWWLFDKTLSKWEKVSEEKKIRFYFVPRKGYRPELQYLEDANQYIIASGYKDEPPQEQFPAQSVTKVHIGDVADVYGVSGVRSEDPSFPVDDWFTYKILKGTQLIKEDVNNSIPIIIKTDIGNKLQITFIKENFLYGTFVGWYRKNDAGKYNLISTSSALEISLTELNIEILAGFIIDTEIKDTGDGGSGAIVIDDEDKGNTGGGGSTLIKDVG